MAVRKTKIVEGKRGVYRLFREAHSGWIRICINMHLIGKKSRRSKMAKSFKPCPFCGERNGIEVRAYTFNIKFVQCDKCGASSGAYDSAEDASHAWNSRDNLWRKLKTWLWRKTTPAELPERTFTD